MFNVIYQSPTNKNWILSDDMNFGLACEFRNKCLDIWYDAAFVVKITERDCH